MEKPPQRRARMTLFLGFAAILILIACSSVFALVEASRHAEASRRSIVESEQSAHALGHARYIGQQVARVRAKTHHAVLAGSAREGLVEQIAEINGDIDAALRELPALLSDAEQAEWRRVAPVLLALRKNLGRALESMHRGERGEARRTLEETIPLSARFFRASESFHHFCAGETERRLQSLAERAAWTRRLQAAAAVLLFLCTLAVAVAVLRLTSRQQRQLALYMDGIEVANRDLEAFAGRVAHDIKNLLHPLLFAVPVLTSSAHNPDAVKKVAGRIERATRRAADIVDGLLALAQASAPPQGTARTSVNDELAQVLDELAPLAERVGATVRLDVEPRLQAACASSLLHVVLLNVLGNSLKFLEGCERREVRVDARRRDDRCVLEVEDTGPGIPREALEKVFEPFFRVRDRKAEGAGIGLATVRRIVDAHGGKISLSSAMGKGTRACIELPWSSVA